MGKNTFLRKRSGLSFVLSASRLASRSWPLNRKDVDVSKTHVVCSSVPWLSFYLDGFHLLAALLKLVSFIFHPTTLFWQPQDPVTAAGPCHGCRNQSWGKTPETQRANPAAECPSLLASAPRAEIELSAGHCGWRGIGGLAAAPPPVVCPHCPPVPHGPTVTEQPQQHGSALTCPRQKSLHSPTEHKEKRNG